MPTPPQPAKELIASRLRDWENLENYQLQDKSLHLLFHRLCPLNSDLEHVLLKVTALNQFYSTNIFDTYSMAKHILQLNVDERLRARDLTLVNELAMITLQGKSKNFYSFASKYCSHHVPDAFPIYDSFVEKMLLHYCAVDRFDVFKKADLKDYVCFVHIIAAFRKYYALDSFTLRQIDVFFVACRQRLFSQEIRQAKGRPERTITLATCIMNPHAGDFRAAKPETSRAQSFRFRRVCPEQEDRRRE